MLQAPAPPKVMFKFRDLGYFFRFVRPIWKIGAVSLILVMITTAMRAVVPLTSKVFIDFVILKTGYDGLAGLLSMIGMDWFVPRAIEMLGSIQFIILGLIVAGISYGVLYGIQGYLTAVYQQELTFNLQTSLFDHVLRFPLSFIKNKQTGYLMSRVSDDVGMLQYMFSDALTQIISSAFYLVFGIAILLSMNAKLALVIAVAIPAYLIIRLVFSTRIRALSYRERESSAAVSQSMQEAISGAELVKSYATEKTEIGKVSERLRDVVNARISKYVLMTMAATFMRGTMFGLLLVIMIVGAADIQAGAMTLGDYVTFLSYIVFLSAAVNTLFYTYLTFQPVFASMDRLKEMFSVAPEFEWEERDRPLKQPSRVDGAIRFEDVSFAYEAGKPLVLRDVSFDVKPGETVALVGHSGAGKSTLVSLLLKLYVPGSGRITLDGTGLEELNHAWLRQQISIVSQDIFLFNDTVENNIKYGRPDASKEDVVRAAKKAHIHEFVETLPRGYETLIGERGTKLSVGQRQRISIARAFLKDTPLLILDEPTSAIDPETEMYLKDSLDELMKGKTTFIISHRMSLTEIADRIIVIEGGRVVQTGTREELAAKKGIFGTLLAFEQGRGDTDNGRTPGDAS
ncbi:MAG: putative ABC transporter ATP-binding protein [Methanocella sp. PtaU1.Bin125]|nr:MAG: putative ABC transporter ATP-binding protein [Methanocella sp. PtaU1.Bin125]